MRLLSGYSLLITEGLTNEVIATRLFVGPKTIEVITGAISSRLDLGVSSESNRRVQAAVLYARHAPVLAGVTSLPARTGPIIRRSAEHEELQRLLACR